MRIHLEWMLNDGADVGCEGCPSIIRYGDHALQDHAHSTWYCRHCAKKKVQEALEKLQRLWYEIEGEPMDMQKVSKAVMDGSVKKSELAAGIAKRFFPDIRVSIGSRVGAILKKGNDDE